ncbi:Myc-type [Macleaya cordata]|uniref:Myc-type n=1 Tax=Macleaya cordata TaxID=56857 RepID=A0A200QWB7_MACCD|nr:Myc-type [Macleaya cordata]
MVTQLREVLKSLCCNNGWSYGVFWRVNRRNCMLLTLEDAYCEENIRIVIEKMFQQAHMMGEGIIGQAAFTGKNRWMFSDTYCGNWDSLGSIDNQDVFKDNSEFRRQFSSGIETIAVISVAPLGVIQFGSTQKILERLEFVDHIKSLFRQMGSVDGLLLGNSPSVLNSEIYDPSGLLTSVVDFGNSYSHCGTTSVHDESCKDLNRRAQSAKVLSQASPFTLGLNNACMSPSMNSYLFHHKHQFQTVGAEAQVILSTPNLELPQILSAATLANNSAAKNPIMSAWSNGSSTLTSFEQQLLSGMGMRGSPITFPANTHTLVPCRNTFQNFQEDSVITSLHGTRGSLSTVDNARSLEINRPVGYSSGNLVDIQLPVPLFNPTEGGPPKGSASFHKFPGEFGPTNATMDSSKRNQVSSDVPSELVAGDTFDGIPVNYSASSMQNSVSTIDSLSVCDEREKSLNFPTQLPNDNNLFDSLGLDFGCSLEKECWDDILMPESDGSHSILSTGISGCISNLDVGSAIGSQTGFFSDFGVENLFDDIVGNSIPDTKPSSEDQLSTAVVTRTGSTSVYSNQVQSTSISCLGGSVDALPPKCNPEKIEKTDVHITHKENLLKSQLGSWVEDSYSINSESAIITKSMEAGQSGKVTRKRARPGESTRPRPKDRQQIQDRVKELREIVPNGAKCSIDSLLDRTIKHMLFLQGVTKYSDTLKQAYEPKIISEDSGIVLKDNSSGGGGATWAFQVGGKTMFCPILVEDLSPLGQMLVEMLCEERGFFLEIADKIRGFGLTILKGVMEVRDDKVWARFVVEANRDVTRMDIFLSLVQLLQQTETSGISTLNQPSKIDSVVPHLKEYQQNIQRHSQSA